MGPSIDLHQLIAFFSSLLIAGCIAQGRGGGGDVQLPSSPLQLFLLMGQSNMEGVPTPAPEDLTEDPRVFVLGFDACKGRAYDEWAIASPPLHRCGGGVGPGDSFGKAIARAWPDAYVGLVPTAIAGVDIDFFRKGVVSKRRKEFRIPPDNSRQGAYDMVVERARIAQKNGAIRGILFHQGESDNASPEWVNKVEGMVADLRTDLGLGEGVPFIAGELLYSGCCASQNSRINELPNVIPNAHVVSANGLNGQDNFHFDLDGQRKLGERYARKMIELVEKPRPTGK